MQQYLADRDGLISSKYMADLFRAQNDTLTAIGYINYTRRLRFFISLRGLEFNMFRSGALAQAFPSEIISYLFPYLVQAIEKPRTCTEYPCRTALLAWSQRAKDTVAFRIADDITTLFRTQIGENDAKYKTI